MTRIKDFYQDLQREELTDHEIAKGLNNGNIETPEYAEINALQNEVILFDAEEGGTDHWSAIHIKY